VLISGFGTIKEDRSGSIPLNPDKTGHKGINMLIVCDIDEHLGNLGQDVINLDIRGDNASIRDQFAKIRTKLDEIEDFILNMDKSV
jgi:hypothetical protein